MKSRRLWELANWERGARDIRRVRWRWRRYARKHSREMAAQQRQFHGRLPGKWRISGENVGVGTDVELIHDAWMRSDEHRRNILDGSFRYMSVGIAKVDGLLWVTEVFWA